MNLLKLTPLFVLILSVTLSSCGDSNSAENAMEDMVEETEYTMSKAMAEVQQESKELADKLKAASGKVDTRMQEIEAEMEGASAVTKAELQQEYNKLEMVSKDLQDRMNRVGDDLEAGWENFKGDFKKGWKDFTAQTRKMLENVEQDLEGEMQ